MFCALNFSVSRNCDDRAPLEVTRFVEEVSEKIFGDMWDGQKRPNSVTKRIDMGGVPPLIQVVGHG